MNKLIFVVYNRSHKHLEISLMQNEMLHLWFVHTWTENRWLPEGCRGSSSKPNPGGAKDHMECPNWWSGPMNWPQAKGVWNTISGRSEPVIWTGERVPENAASINYAWKTCITVCTKKNKLIHTTWNAQNNAHCQEQSLKVFNIMNPPSCERL